MHRRLGHTEACGSVAHGKIHKILLVHYLLFDVVKHRQGVLQRNVVFRQTERVGRVGKEEAIVDVFRAVSALVPQNVERAVLRDFANPSVAVGLLVETLGIVDDFDKSVLHRILGKRTFVQDALRNGQHSGGNQARQSFQRSVISVGNIRNTDIYLLSS